MNNTVLLKNTLRQPLPLEYPGGSVSIASRGNLSCPEWMTKSENVRRALAAKHLVIVRIDENSTKDDVEPVVSSNELTQDATDKEAEHIEIEEEIEDVGKFGVDDDNLTCLDNVVDNEGGLESEDCPVLDFASMMDIVYTNGEAEQ